MKIHKSVVNQIVKYIKDEPVASGNTAMSAAKVPKINRSKVTTDVRSAGSTLIRKAMADAHKSLTTKEDPLKVCNTLRNTWYAPFLSRKFLAYYIFG